MPYSAGDVGRDSCTHLARRNYKTRTGRCLREKLISDHGLFSFFEGQQRAANGQSSSGFFRDAQDFGRLDAGSRAGFTSSRPPLPWTPVCNFLETIGSKTPTTSSRPMDRLVFVMVRSASSLTTPVGCVTKDNEDLFCARLDGRDVLWIPEQAKKNQTWLMVCVYMKGAGHRGIVGTLQRLQGYCCWFRMEVHVTEFVKQCLHCIDSKAGEKVPRPP